MVTGGRYGFMRDVEEVLLDSILDKLKTQFGEIRGIEVGVFGAGTTRGIYRRGKEIDCPVQLVGIDFEQYRPNPTPDPNYQFIAEDSMDAWRKIKDKGWNFLFVDGCHCVNHSMADFLNYSPFVVVGGYTLFHDTAVPTFQPTQEAWPQDHSYAGKPSSILGVREGLKKLGLLQGYRSDWKLIEEIPSDTGLMGVCLFQKLQEL
jgi:hypothetical protein